MCTDHVTDWSSPLCHQSENYFQELAESMCRQASDFIHGMTIVFFYAKVYCAVSKRESTFEQTSDRTVIKDGR